MTAASIREGLRRDKEDLENGNRDFDELAERFRAYASVLYEVVELATKPPKPVSMHAKTHISGDELLWLLDCIFAQENRGQA